MLIMRFSFNYKLVQFLFAAFVFISPFAALADKPVKVNFSGTITDAVTKQPLAGASVYISDIKTGVIADDKGHFIFMAIPAGHHLIEISYSGYTSIVEHVDMITDLEKNFELHPSVVENRGVIVTGVASATSLRKSPVPVTLIRKNDLVHTASTNIIDALSKQPGITQLQTGPGISKPVIRGLGYNRVVVINDGVRQEGQQWGDEHGIEIDEASVNRVEILKGPASLIYGSDAMAGVINFLSSVPVAEGTIKGNILTNWQSNNGLLALNGNLAGNRNGFNWNTYISGKSAHSYKNKLDGIVLNSGFNELNFGGYAGINKGWGYSHLIFSRFNQQMGLIEGDRDAATGQFLLYSGTPLERIATDTDLESGNLFIPRQHIIHTKLVSDNNFTAGSNRIKLNIGFQNNQRMELGNPEDEKEKELYFNLNTVNYNTQLVFAEKKEWRTSIGVNGIYQTNTNKGKESIIPNYNLFDAGVFVYTQKTFQKTTLSGGARFDNRYINSKQMLEGTDIKFTAFKKSYFNFSGSAGVAIEPDDHVAIKLNIARGFRAPNLAELASNGAHEGTDRYEYGSTALHSEQSFQLDAGLELDYKHVSFNLNGFYNSVNNFIYYRRLESVFGGDSLIDDNGELREAFRFDQSDARLFGFETGVDIHPHPLDWLHFENSFSFVRGKLNEPVDNSNNLAFIPAPRLITELRTEFKKAGPVMRRLYFHLEMINHFKQNKPFTAYNTETATSAYLLLNAGAGVDFTKGEKTLFSLHLALDNITDKAWQNHLSRLKYTAVNNITGRQGVFNKGRNYSVKVNVPFSFR
jgi:iron complex outermembrane receptor protein